MIPSILSSPQVLSSSPFLFSSLPIPLVTNNFPALPSSPTRTGKIQHDLSAGSTDPYLSWIINLGPPQLQSCHFSSQTCRNWDLFCSFKLLEVDKMVRKTKRWMNSIITWFLFPGEIKLKIRDLLCGNKSDECITQVSFSLFLLFNSLTLTRKQERDRFTIGTVWNGHLYIVPMCSLQSHR